MNILVTGSNGFVGSKLMWELESLGHLPLGIDISSHCDATAHPNTLIGDIRKLHDLEAVLRFEKLPRESGIDLVIHCAASKHDFGISREEYFSHNKYGTKELLGFMEGHKIKRLVYISTVSVFGHPKGMADEEESYNPDHPYGESKLAGEILSIDWQKQDAERELIVLRPTVIYGPHNFANLYKLLDTLHRRPYVTVGSGSHVKSIVSLRTVLDMIIFCLDKLKPGFEHYNCVDEPYITLAELMRTIAQTPGFKVPAIKIPIGLAIAIGMVFDIPAKLFSIDLPVNSDRMRKFSTATYFTARKIRKEGFIQKQSIQQSIAQMCEWYLTETNKHK